MRLPPAPSLNKAAILVRSALVCALSLLFIVLIPTYYPALAGNGISREAYTNPALHGAPKPTWKNMTTESVKGNVITMKSRRRLVSSDGVVLTEHHYNNVVKDNRNWEVELNYNPGRIGVGGLRSYPGLG